MARMSVVSMPMPPSCRKPSMPARCVTTWKFTPRRPRAMAKRIIFAISQPAISTMSASPRRGRKSATCARNTRAGSIIMSKRSMSVSFQQRHQPLRRDMDPIRPVVHLVAQLVEHFLDLGELQEAAHVVERAEDAAALHRRRVGLEERLARGLLPRAQRGPQLFQRGLGALAQLRRAARIAERAQHARDIAQRRVLAARFRQWA